MKKALLVTLQDKKSMGNRLQNYALQTLIKKSGFEVYNMVFDNVISVPFSRKVKLSVKKTLSFLGLKRYNGLRAEKLRIDKVKSFNDTYIDNYIRVNSKILDENNWDSFEYAITGSDQVWHNWHLIPDELDYYYLEFISKEKRISYAPSFGFDSFPQQDLIKHKSGLINMHGLSCRELRGCDIIFNLTGRRAEKVLDPTLLLTTEEWEKIERKPAFEVPENYVLMFFLGEITPDVEKENERIARLFNGQLLNINDKNDITRYAIDPSEFVWLIHNSCAVCTDSFHATVFSLLFEKKIRVFKRASQQTEFNNMFDRIQSLLEPIGLMKLVFDGETKDCAETDLSSKMSNDAKKAFDVNVKKSLDYLFDQLSQ